MIYTRTGDTGETWLGNKRVEKDCELVELVGDLDEAASLLGAVVARYPETAETLEPVIRTLMEIAAHVGTGGKYRPEVNVKRYEELIDRFWGETGDIDKFVLRFTDPAAAEIHYARSVVRRAERRYVSALKEGQFDREFLSVLNRVSDLLFAYARWINKRRGGEEILY